MVNHHKKSRNNIIIYSVIWSIAIVILIISLLQNLGFAKAINYSGIVRGATQRLVKKEISNQPDDKLIAYLDDVLHELSTGDGQHGIIKVKDDEYQNQLADMKVKWEAIKTEIEKVREGGSPKQLFLLSEDYYYAADAMVRCVELYSNKKLKQLIIFFLAYMIVSMSAFMLWYRFKQKELYKVQYIDSLTGIGNLTSLEITISGLQEKKDEKELVLLCLDVDDFKFLNSSYGYALGDSILCIIANAIKKAAIRPDYCARSGADKFYLLAENREDLMEYVKGRIQGDIEEQSQLDITNDITFSFGGFVIGEEKNTREIIDHVDLAHKNAKSMNTGNIVWYDDTLTNKLLEDSIKLKQMHKGLENEEFMLYLQPKFNISDRKIIGAEALVRWKFSDEVLLYPDSFIPLFEKNGVIYELDFYMLEKTCAFVKKHNLDKRNFKISINFSRVTLYRKNFSEKLFSILKEYELSPECLELEITESSINGLADPILALLEELRDKGFSLSMDDFGTGYSSLSLLSSLHVDILKIDKEFLLDKRNEKSLQDVLELIIKVAHTLNIYVVCEGVETETHAELLKKLSCDYGQGYLISRPIDEDHFQSIYL